MNALDTFSLADWVDAEEMPLRCEPSSDASTALVATILADLEFPAGKLLKASTTLKRSRALGALLADLLRLEALGLAGSHGMDKALFPSKVLGFGFDPFSHVKGAMVAEGLLEFKAGKARWHTSDGFQAGASVSNLGGWVARFRLTPKARERVKAAGVPLESWSEHWRRGGPIKPEVVSALSLPPLVCLKESNAWVGGAKRKGEAVSVPLDHPTVAAIVEDLKAHNTFIHARGVEGIDFIGLRRLFNEGEKPEKLWRSGGRFYSISVNGVGTRYENMTGERRRAEIRLAGRAVGEVDMSASQLRLLYALQGVDMPAGLEAAPYDLPGLDRDAVKIVVAQALGKARGRSKGWGKDTTNEYAKRTAGRSLPTDYDFATYQNATLAAHPILETLGKPGVPTALDLQFVESNIVGHAMGALRAKGIASLPVHDSLIVALEHLEDAEKVLENAFVTQVTLEVGQPTAHRAKVSRKGA